MGFLDLEELLQERRDGVGKRREDDVLRLRLLNSNRDLVKEDVLFSRPVEAYFVENRGYSGLLERSNLLMVYTELINILVSGKCERTEAFQIFYAYNRDQNFLLL